MFSQEELKQIHRRKKVVVARSDLLRGEGGQAWAALERRMAGVESRFAAVRRIPPAVYMASFAALSVLRRRYAPRHKLLGPIFSAVGYTLNVLGPREEAPELPDRNKRLEAEPRPGVH